MVSTFTAILVLFLKSSAPLMLIISTLSTLFVLMLCVEVKSKYHNYVLAGNCIDVDSL